MRFLLLLFDWQIPGHKTNTFYTYFVRGKNSKKKTVDTFYIRPVFARDE